MSERAPGEVPAAPAAVNTEPAMYMESTASFERHLEEVVNEARAVDNTLRETGEAIKAFESQVKSDEEEAMKEQERADMEVEDLALMALEEEEELADGEWRPEIILGRRSKDNGKKIFYKVKWKGINLVTWEPADSIEAPKLIEEFDRCWLRAAFKPSSKLRPVFYGKHRQAAINRGHALDRARHGTWSCEVEPMIWIPYDEGLQRIIENGFVTGQKSVLVNVSGVNYTIEFDAMIQKRQVGPGGVRRGHGAPVRGVVHLVRPLDRYHRGRHRLAANRGGHNPAARGPERPLDRRGHRGSRQRGGVRAADRDVVLLHRTP